MPDAEALAFNYGWNMKTPWRQLRQLYPLLLDMTPCDVTAFVLAAERTGFNPVALLIMAVAKHPEFIAAMSELVCAHGLMDPNTMARAIKSAVTGLGRNEEDNNWVWHVCMEPLTVALERLGILEPNDAKAGILLAAGRFAVVRGVPSNLQACFDAVSSHQFPDVTTASDIPGYLKSWCKFLTMLPATLDVGDDSDGLDARSIIVKLNLWLKSRFPDASPTSVGDATGLWPVGSRLNQQQRMDCSLAIPLKVSSFVAMS